MQSGASDSKGETRADREKTEWKQLKKALLEFRKSAQESAERPEAFWESQRLAVRARLHRPNPARARRRPAWAWASAAVVMVLGLTFLIERQESPKPDFAAGYDQQLLLDVERAIERDVPAPLEPAALLPEEMFPRIRITAEP